MLEVLWELAHLPTLPTSLVQQALEEHLGILSDAYAVKETVKRSYIIKCIEDIKKVRRQMYHKCLALPLSVCCSISQGLARVNLERIFFFLMEEILPWSPSYFLPAALTVLFKSWHVLVKAAYYPSVWVCLHHNNKSPFPCVLH